MKHAAIFVLTIFVFGCSSDENTKDEGVGWFEPPSTPDSGTTKTVEPDVHRPVEVACDNDRNTSNAGNGSWTCTNDSDCTDGDNGRCSELFTQDGWLYEISCSYDKCFSDTDCENICKCGGESAGSPSEKQRS